MPVDLRERTNDEWIVGLQEGAKNRDLALRDLHELLMKATRHQVNRKSAGYTLGASTREEIAVSAAHEAMLSVLKKLDSFEGRSRFTTWVFKFGILQANVEMRRTMWRDRDVHLDDSFEFQTDPESVPEAKAELNDLKRLLNRAMAEVLTSRQRQVAKALIVDEVPIDVLAERMETNRNALYKTLHDVRKKLRSYLLDAGITSAEGDK